MLARPCGKVEVVDEDVMSHAQLGEGNLLIVPGTTDGVLEVKADQSVLVLGKELLHVRMELSTETGSFVYTTERAFPSRGCPLCDAW